MKINVSMSKSGSATVSNCDLLQAENKALRDEIARYRKQLKQFTALLYKFEELVPISASKDLVEELDVMKILVSVSAGKNKMQLVELKTHLTQLTTAHNTATRKYEEAKKAILAKIKTLSEE